MEKQEFKDGYYWVKLNNEWMPAEFSYDMWYITQGMGAMETKDFQKIGSMVKQNIATSEVGEPVTIKTTMGGILMSEIQVAIEGQNYERNRYGLICSKIELTVLEGGKNFRFVTDRKGIDLGVNSVIREVKEIDVKDLIHQGFQETYYEHFKCPKCGANGLSKDDDYCCHCGVKIVNN